MKLNKYDDNLTVGELKKVVAQEKKLEQQKEEQEIQAIKNEFENTYLKYIEEDSLFGRELNIIQLKEFVRKERTTDWNFVYHFEGNEISFSKKFLNYKKFNTDRVENNFSAKDLKKMTKITQQEYEYYENEYLRLQTDLESLIE